MSNLIYELAQHQLRELPLDVRVVLIHPNFAAHHLLLNELLQEEAVIYIRLEGQALSSDALTQQLKAALSTQPLRLGEARYVIVDECDRAAGDSLDVLVKQILVGLETGRLVLFSRSLANVIERKPDWLEQAHLVPVNHTLMLPNYLRPNTNSTLLEVRMLGRGRVLLNGRPIDDWDGTLPRSLFFYLVDRGMTTRNEVFETFWSNLSAREATNVFHVTKRKISEVLGVDLTTYWSSFYRISPHIELNYDVALFSEMVQNSAVAAPEEAESLLINAISLYRDHFLTGIGDEMSWVQQRRQALNQTYSDALIALGKLWERAGKRREALGLYVRASAHNRQREDLAENIMMLYRDLDMPEEALATYKRLETEIGNTLGISPAQRLQSLAASLQRHMVSGGI